MAIKPVIEFKFRNSRRLCGYFFVILLCSTSYSKPENNSEIIERAFNQSLQKQRPLAIQTIVGAIHKDVKKTGKVPHDLQKALAQIATNFQSDRAQQLYELALSLRPSDLSLANAKLLEALKDDPENVAIGSVQIQNQIIAGDCGSALVAAKKLRDQIEYLEDLDLLVGQAAVCAAQFDVYLGLASGVDRKSSNLNLYWDLLEMEYFYRSGKFDKGLALAASLLKSEPALPESSYWRWKISSEEKSNQKSLVSGQGPSPEESANRYLNLCRTMSPRQTRAYLLEPFLCRRTVEVETYLKKQNNETK